MSSCICDSSADFQRLYFPFSTESTHRITTSKRSNPKIAYTAMFISSKSYSDTKDDLILLIDINLGFAFVPVQMNKLLLNSVNEASAIKRTSVSGV